MSFRLLLRVVIFCALTNPSHYGRLFAQEVKWQPDYASARREATKTNRPVLCDFGTEACVWCRKLDAIFQVPAVAKYINEHFVAVRIDANKESRLSDSLGIQSFPTVVIASPDGKVINRHSGFMDAGELKRMLEAATAKTGAAAKDAELVSTRTNSTSDEAPFWHCQVSYVQKSRDTKKEDIEAEEPTPFDFLIQQSIAELHLEQARECILQGKRVKALDSLDKAIRLGGDSAAAQSARGLIEKLK
jgi:thioredoxin-related protein